MSMELPIIDEAVLNELKMSVGGDTSFVAEVAQAYLSEGDGHIAQISAGLADGDVAAMVRPAHTLKSSSAALGAARLADICRSIEHAARDGQLDRLDALVAEATAAWQETVAAMTEMGLAAS